MTGNSITDCNDAAVRLLKCTSKDEVLMKRPAELSPEFQPDGTPSAEKSAEVNALARKNGYHRFEWIHRKNGGETFPVQVTLNAVEINGEPSLIAVWHDLTELKQKEDRLRQANQKMKKELEAAARIQRTLLPVSSPLIRGLKASWLFKPSDELGGDMLNIFLLDEKHLGIYVLDVTGHGVAASLLSVTVSQFLSPFSETSFVRNPRAENKCSAAGPAEVAGKLNRHFSSHPDSSQLFTLFYGVLDLNTRELNYICAGHPPPAVISPEGKPRFIEGSGMPIGVTREAVYEESRLKLNEGDRLYLYSDGITEAKNLKKELYGPGRFLKILEAVRKAPLAESLEHITREVESWCTPHTPGDDITVLACELSSSH